MAGVRAAVAVRLTREPGFAAVRIFLELRTVSFRGGPFSIGTRRPHLAEDGSLRVRFPGASAGAQDAALVNTAGARPRYFPQSGSSVAPFGSLVSDGRILILKF
jgi:hypothetical protein